MRIISGKFKGRKLSQPLNKNTRPLKDIVKESIFNLILHSKVINLNLEESNILDLFSGSGSFGIECLSRNVKYVTFIENYKPAIDILKKNINELDTNKNYDLIEQNIFNEKIYINLNKKYDLIFIDPPYSEKKIENLLKIGNIKNKSPIILSIYLSEIKRQCPRADSNRHGLFSQRILSPSCLPIPSPGHIS